MATTRARLLDLSLVQTHLVDFKKVKAAGYDGVYLKATEGSHYVDPEFDTSCTRAHAADLLVGAYLFLTTGSPVQDQVALFVGTTQGRLDLPPALDFEAPSPEKWIPPITGEWLTERADQAASLLERAFSTLGVVIYTYNYFGDALPDTPALRRLIKRRLWIAWYPDEQHEPTDAMQPRIPKLWKAAGAVWWLWQWSGDKGAAAPGVPCVVDHNVFNGTPDDLATVPLPDEDTNPGSPLA